MVGRAWNDGRGSQEDLTDRRLYELAAELQRLRDRIARLDAPPNAGLERALSSAVTFADLVALGLVDEGRAQRLLDERQMYRR